MAANSYVPFYPSDWLAGTRGLSAAETGVYITLIAMMYERGGPLSMDKSRLARLCGTTPNNFNKALSVLIDEGKITEAEDGLWNEKVAEVLSRVCEKRTAAKASADARWSKKSNENNDSNHANASESQCERNANQRPKAKEHIYRFDEFWDCYPHRDGVKRGKKPSRQKYERAVRSGVSEQEIIDGAKRAHQDRTVINGFSRNPEVWLNQEGWTDEVVPPSGQATRWDKLAAGGR